MADHTREGTVYLTLYKGRYTYELRVDKATNKKPRSTPEGSIVVKINVRVPNAAFEPISPEVTIDVPAELIQHPVQVTAEDAT